MKSIPVRTGTYVEQDVMERLLHGNACLNLLTRNYTTGRQQHYSREDRERLVANNFIVKQTHKTQGSEEGAKVPYLDD
jgi:hypothetical protein